MVIINDLRVELGMSIILKATQRNIQSCFFVFLQKPFNAVFGFWLQHQSKFSQLPQITKLLCLCQS